MSPSSVKGLLGLSDAPDTPMSFDAAAWYLNVPLWHERRLLDAGFIRAAFPEGDTSSKAGTILKSSLDAFLVRLLSKADPDLVAGRPIPAAGRIADRSSMDVVSALFHGRLTKVGLDPDSRGYLAVLVDPDEVRSLFDDTPRELPDPDASGSAGRRASAALA